jgi:hypothetical protein
LLRGRAPVSPCWAGIAFGVIAAYAWTIYGEKLRFEGSGDPLI